MLTLSVTFLPKNYLNRFTYVKNTARQSSNIFETVKVLFKIYVSKLRISPIYVLHHSTIYAVVQQNDGTQKIKKTIV